MYSHLSVSIAHHRLTVNNIQHGIDVSYGMVIYFVNVVYAVITLI